MTDDALERALAENRRRSEVMARSAMRLQRARRDEAPVAGVGPDDEDSSEEVTEPDG